MLRLRQICLVSSELEKTVSDIQGVFGLDICYRDPSVAKYGLKNTLLPIGSNFLEIVAPFRNGTAAERFLKKRGGDGGYMVILECDDVAKRERRMQELDIRIINKLEYPSFQSIQMHPRDTGAAIIETGTDARRGKGPGPWHPAGDNWEAAVRTDVVSALVAAEMQSDEPKNLATRWSEVLDVAIEQGDDGIPTLRLDNAELRFTNSLDNRGEGLTTLCLRTVKQTQILREATVRGCTIDNDTVTICGTRFKLS